jgi:hypothetical protein
MPVVRSYEDGLNSPYEYPFTISGVTRDASGNPLPNCSVVIFRTPDNSVAAVGTSDASGHYALGASPVIQQYAVGYLPGSPDVAGTTVNTLTGT